ncbi:hypothetical protein Tco_0439009 [Tanacetum coccineum]
MLCYLARMEPYYIKCIKDGPFQPKTTEGDAKSESQWTPDERRVVVQDQRLKSIIMSCLPDDIIESVIICISTKETWTDLVHSFEGTPISSAFFSNNVIRDFQENFDDEVDERTGKSLKLLESKDFLTKEQRFVTKTFDWDEEEVSDEEEVTQVKVLMALADDELTVRKSHARNGE